MLERGSDQGTTFTDLPQIIPAKVAAAEFALILSIMAGAIVAPAFRVTMIDTTVKPFSGGVLKLFVPHGAKRHATHLVVPVRTRLLIAQNGIVFFAPDVGALKSDELVVFRIFNDHGMNRVNVLYNMHLHDFYFHIELVDWQFAFITVQVVGR